MISLQPRKKYRGMVEDHRYLMWIPLNGIGMTPLMIAGEPRDINLRLVNPVEIFQPLHKNWIVRGEHEPLEIAKHLETSLVRPDFSFFIMLHQTHPRVLTPIMLTELRDAQGRLLD